MTIKKKKKDMMQRAKVWGVVVLVKETLPNLLDINILHVCIKWCEPLVVVSCFVAKTRKGFGWLIFFSSLFHFN